MSGTESDSGRARARGSLDRVAGPAPYRGVAAAAGDRLPAQLTVEELVAAAATEDRDARHPADRLVVAAAADDRIAAAGADSRVAGAAAADRLIASDGIA